MQDVMMSTINATPVGKFIYSAWSFYATRRGGELPGPWILAALDSLGRSARSVRQTLYRMERDRQLESRRVGRMKYYRLAVSAQQEINSGLSMFFDPPEAEWDGQWTFVRFGFSGDQRADRDRLRNVLDVEGFASLGGGTFLHLRDRTERILKSAAALGADGNLLVFRGMRAGGESDAALAGRLWDLDGIADGYRSFLEQFEPILEVELEDIPPHRAFLVRFALAIEYLEVAWRDPELPQEFLPDDWPGHTARAAARELYDRLLPGSLAFGDELMAELNVPWLPAPPSKRDLSK